MPAIPACTASSLIPHFIRWCYSSSADHLGNFLTGIAAILGLLLAIWGTKKEIPKWRRLKITEMEAEVAGKTLHVVHRVFDAFNLITLPTVDAPVDILEESGDHKRTYQSRRDLVDRLERTKDDINSFFSTWNLAKTYLDDEADKILQEIWDEWVSVKVDIPMWLDYLDSKNHNLPHAQELYAKTFGSIGNKKREELLNKAVKYFKPITRMEK